MTRIWNVVWTVVALLGAGGIICVVASMFMGLDINQLTQSDMASVAFDKLNPAYVIDLISSLFN